MTLFNPASDKFQAEEPFHVLALSGGGFRGLYAARVLEELEASFGSPIASKFDLICGTSAGGLLALGLAKGLPAADLRRMFEEDGQKIFVPLRSRLLRFGGWLGRAKHSSAGLRAVLEERFGKTTLGELSHRVLIPTVNCTTGKGQFFKTPHSPRFEKDHTRTLVDVGLATAAAPTYFPMHRIDGEGVFADGGLVGNSPGIFGLHEARTFLDVPNASVRVLSVGTMTAGATIRGAPNLDRGIPGWGRPLFDLVISAQEAAVDFALQHALGDRYMRIDDLLTAQQTRDVGLDIVTPASIDVLTTRGTQAARAALGNSKIEAFRSHTAPEPKFFYGPRAEVS